MTSKPCNLKSPTKFDMCSSARTCTLLMRNLFCDIMSSVYTISMYHDGISMFVLINIKLTFLYIKLIDVNGFNVDATDRTIIFVM